ncbi:WXG100 family type VII secretion target [Goodfellowiella coeruleoviolacea]|uniref:Uncharacterized protein n=1 Tax=Goodfellowiella coeruleoviolacea TaxID=334858 RepID=A0AAE3GQ76_9PSEU|nr:WXG100 family type VII secretion target [Goodfellowiella coeruleoviolacea]MCP2170158.1 hypothetical protein [Goodfellowiella coeruleoviolacea]
MDISQVTEILRAGFTLLDVALGQVTGQPGELRAKAQECDRCAAMIGSAASSTNQVVTQLGQTWNGRSYDACQQASTQLVDQLNNVLKRSLEQESQRLVSSADALEKARQAIEQLQQTFTQAAQVVVRLLNIALRLLAFGQKAQAMVQFFLALRQAITAKKMAEAVSKGITAGLSQLLTTLFSGIGTSSSNTLALTSASR